ncbi:hypothetical protein Cfla_0306 [Cellulomonas flavigena DSM 20109]|uniref:DUF4253 domain-containing protein n=1 Tax=Cellulomonas flavigena (strain ATCC 482 / DSM 20109 / BCRC 11376 / JCM 18109 / NBRC 3775 / NCIMB 8073 / NRS 134) TaxID=446466 RepID=D5UH22_CELFN|nr:DUF4253 domain-containing protein [Cellulomonas flavigena]ADG73225.1 hypothetical protein Cfla_0306 [Cellulomonas flavigena DSM 20109]
MGWWSNLFGRTPERGPAPGAAARADAADVAATHVAATHMAATVREPGERPPTRVLGVTSSGVEVRGFDAPAGELVAWWHRLRAEHATTGLWPVLLGADAPTDMTSALTPEDDYDDADALRRATAMTLRELQELRAERLARWREADSEDEDERPGDSAPHTVEHREPVVTVAEEDGVIALVPAAHGWQVPVILGWQGGVNYELEPVDHGVVLRDWHERYGAELVAMSGDQVLELLVDRPPTTPAEALAVAREQYDYCGDVVDQGVGTIEALAREQAGSASWYFWWD